MLGGGGLAALVGVGPGWLYRAIGAALVFFGFGLLRNSRRAEIDLAEVQLAVAMDWLWVVGSAVLVLLAPGVSNTGGWIVAIVGLVVADFAVIQGLGMRRLRKRARPGVA